MVDRIFGVILIFSFSFSVSSEGLKIPNGIKSTEAYNAYQQYLKEGNKKAFSVSKQGAWSWSAQQATLNKAIKIATDSCRLQQKGKCDVIDSNGKLLTGYSESIGFLQKTVTPKDGFQFFPISIVSINQAEVYMSAYLPALGNKAYAASLSGANGWFTDAISIKKAKLNALKTCQSYNTVKDQPCHIVDINGKIVGNKLKFSEMYLSSKIKFPDMTSELSEIIDLGVYKNFRKIKGHKALAIASTGFRHVIGMMTSAEHAEKAAIKACNDSSGEQCKLVFLDKKIVYIVPENNKAVVSGDVKPWYGKYIVDLSNNPELLSKKGSMPVFFFTQNKAIITVAEKVVLKTSYFENDNLLTIKYHDKYKTGTFSNNYKTLILGGQFKSQYIKVEDE